MFVKLLMLLFDGFIRTDDGGVGKLSMHPNEDVEDEAVADIMLSAMIDEGDDCDEFSTVGRKSRSFIWDGELSAGGHRESKAISCVHFGM